MLQDDHDSGNFESKYSIFMQENESKMLSAKWRSFCVDLDVLNDDSLKSMLKKIYRDHSISV